MEKIEVVSPKGQKEMHTHANARDLVANAGWTYGDKKKKARPAVNAKSGAAAAKVEAQAVIDNAAGGSISRESAFGEEADDNDE